MMHFASPVKRRKIPENRHPLAQICFLMVGVESLQSDLCFTLHITMWQQHTGPLLWLQSSILRQLSQTTNYRNRWSDKVPPTILASALCILACHCVPVSLTEWNANSWRFWVKQGNTIYSNGSFFLCKSFCKNLLNCLFLLAQSQVNAALFLKLKSFLSVKKTHEWHILLNDCAMHR